MAGRLDLGLREDFARFVVVLPFSAKVLCTPILAEFEQIENATDASSLLRFLDGEVECFAEAAHGAHHRSADRQCLDSLQKPYRSEHGETGIRKRTEAIGCSGSHGFCVCDAPIRRRVRGAPGRWPESSQRKTRASGLSQKSEISIESMIRNAHAEHQRPLPTRQVQFFVGGTRAEVGGDSAHDAHRVKVRQTVQCLTASTSSAWAPPVA